MSHKNWTSDNNPVIDFRQLGPLRPKRLVEECCAIMIGAVQRRFGKRALLTAIRRCQPIRIPISYNPPFEVWLTYQVHPLVKRPGKWSALETGTARILFVCSGCRRPVTKLFYYVESGSQRASELLCRRCHNLAYLSQNCAGNKFYMHVGRPYRRLQQLRECLQAKSLSRCKRADLEWQKQVLESYLRDAIQRFGRKSWRGVQNREPHRFSAGGKRVYKNLELASSALGTTRYLKDLAAESRHQRRSWETGNLAPRVPSGGSGALLGVSPPNGGSASSGEAPVPPYQMDQKRLVQTNPTDKPQEKPESEKTLEQQLGESAQRWIKAIRRWRAEGLLTDELLSRSPALKRLLATYGQR